MYQVLLIKKLGGKDSPFFYYGDAQSLIKYRKLLYDRGYFVSMTEYGSLSELGKYLQKLREDFAESSFTFVDDIKEIPR